MNTQCTQRCGRPPSKHRLSLRYRRQGSFFVGAAAVRADQGQPKDDAQSSQRGAKHEKRKNTRTGAHHAENSRKKLPQVIYFLKLHARVVLQKSATETDEMPQLRFWARSPMRCQAHDTALVAPAAGSTHPLSNSALGMSVEAVFGRPILVDRLNV